MCTRMFVVTVCRLALTLGVAAALSFGAADEIVRFVSAPATKPVNGHVSVIDSNTAWIGLLSTTDGGASWTMHRPPDASAAFFVAYSTQPAGMEQTYFITARRG